jgi:DNA-directed RNA polymerase specialized sigma24 family protein
MSYFAGMQREEIAEVLQVSAATVDRDLRFARAFLNRQLGG